VPSIASTSVYRHSFILDHCIARHHVRSVQSTYAEAEERQGTCPQCATAEAAQPLRRRCADPGGPWEHRKQQSRHPRDWPRVQVRFEKRGSDRAERVGCRQWRDGQQSHACHHQGDHGKKGMPPVTHSQAHADWTRSFESTQRRTYASKSSESCKSATSATLRLSSPSTAPSRTKPETLCYAWNTWTAGKQWDLVNSSHTSLTIPADLSTAYQEISDRSVSMSSARSLSPY